MAVPTFSWMNNSGQGLLPTFRGVEDVKKDYAEALARLNSATDAEDKAILSAEVQKYIDEASRFNLTTDDLNAYVGGVTPPMSSGALYDVNNPLSVRAYSDSLAAKAARDNAIAMEKGYDLEKVALGAGVGNEALKVILGAAQMATAHNTLKNLKAPKYPEYNVDMQPLKDRIYQAQKLASGINPLLARAQAGEQATADLASKQLAAGASGGNSGTYAALMTAAHANRLENARKNELMNQEVARGYQKDLDNLIATKMMYDTQRFNAAANKFNSYDFPEYQTARQGALATSQQGLKNISSFGESLPSWIAAYANRTPTWEANKTLINGI